MLKPTPRAGLKQDKRPKISPINQKNRKLRKIGQGQKTTQNKKPI